MKRATIITAALVATMASAHAGQFVMNYRDLVRPHGRPRSDSIFQAAVEACYARTGADRTLADTPAFKRCMLTRGYRWQSTQLASSPASPEPPLASGKPPVGTYTYYDARMPRGRERNEAEEQAATRACDAGDPDRIGTGAFNSCMRTHGWRFASFAPNPPAPAAEPASPVFDEEAFDEEQRGNEEQRRNQEQ
ncbi:MAG: hypothetical protein JO366_16650, partial [Methylobacteriaceae bacterium]|nr:hypothetical protein [Methylobacteriaceae bacterium]